MTEPQSTESAQPARHHLLPGVCPRCRQGELFAGPLTLSIRNACPRCGLDYGFADSGDGPAVFAIFILGFVVLGLALIAEFKFGVSPWLHVLLWGGVTPALGFVVLRALKSRLLREQYRHQAGEARSAQKDD